MFKKSLFFFIAYSFLISSSLADINRVTKETVEKLNDKDEQTRIDAANSLGFLDDKTVTPYLIKALEDNSTEVKKAAIIALANLRDKTAIPHIRKFLSEPTLYWPAVYSLGILGDEEAIDKLAELLKDKNITRRKFAVYAISQIISKPALKVLEDAKSMEDSKEVKDEIEKAITYLKSKI
jgi:HEAT repeat protein